jgi:hypothetical protein
VQWCYIPSSILIEFVPMLQIQFRHNMGPTSFHTPMYSIPGYGGVFGPPSPVAPIYTGYGGPPQVQIVFGSGFGVDAGTRDKSDMYNEEVGKARAEDTEIRAAAFQTDAFAFAMPMQPTLYNPPPMSPSTSFTPAPSTALPAARSDTTSTCMPISETPSLSCPSL